MPQQLAELSALPSPSTAGLTPQDLASPQVAHALAAPPSAIKSPTAPAAAIGVGAVGEVQVDGMPLQDINRLGDVLTRQRAEFPTEIDAPVRIKEAIRVRYPAAAMAAGREDSVAVWAIVDPRGDPDEVLVLDGTPEFAEAVVAAVKATKFVPAQNDLLPRRYPIALEFRFVLGEGAATDGATVARQP
jgi:TonB family protein